MEPRPELWGVCAAVLNRLQWLLPLLPCSIDDMFISREDVIRQLNTLERRLSERRGQKGTAPAATAYPKVNNLLGTYWTPIGLGQESHHQRLQTGVGSR